MIFILFALSKILFNRDGLDNSIIWITYGIVLGYRTFEPIQGLKLHPIEILVYATVLRIIVTNIYPLISFPKIIVFLGYMFISFFIIDILTRYNPMVLLEFKNAFLLIAIFFIIRHVEINENIFTLFSLTYLKSVTLISFLGLLEYNYPEVMSSIFGFQNNYSFDTKESILFNRLAFLYWGSHLAANLIPPVFPILIFLKWKEHALLKSNIILTLIFLLNLFAVYLSGNRISWLILTIFLILTLFYFKNRLLPYLKSYSIIIISVFIIYIYSQPVEGRYLSTYKALVGNIDKKYDSSSHVRMQRALTAIKSMSKNPMGTGWGSQGWVHSDVLQVGASLGIISGILLICGPLFLTWKSIQYYIFSPLYYKPPFFLCILLFIYILTCFSLNGNILKVQTGAPLFLIWALCWGYLEYNNKLNINLKFQK